MEKNIFGEYTNKKTTIRKKVNCCIMGEKVQFNLKVIKYNRLFSNEYFCSVESELCEPFDFYICESKNLFAYSTEEPTNIFVFGNKFDICINYKNFNLFKALFNGDVLKGEIVYNSLIKLFELDKI